MQFRWRNNPELRSPLWENCIIYLYSIQIERPLSDGPFPCNPVHHVVVLVIAVVPGQPTQIVHVIREPEWEFFEYERQDVISRDVEDLSQCQEEYVKEQCDTW